MLHCHVCGFEFEPDALDYHGQVAAMSGGNLYHDLYLCPLCGTAVVDLQSSNRYDPRTGWLTNLLTGARFQEWSEGNRP